MNKKQLPTQKQFADTAVQVKSIDQNDKIITGIVASDGLIDRHGESLNPNGWKLNGHVPVLWGHQYENLPIGKTINERVEDGKLLIDVKLSKKYSVAQDIFDLIVEEMIGKVSVGFIPLAFDDSGAFTYAEQELLELSFVNVPANPRAGIRKDFDVEGKIKSIEDGLAILSKELENKTLEKGDDEDQGQETPPELEEAENSESSEPKNDETITKSELKSVILEALTEYDKVKETEKISKIEDEKKSITSALVAMREHLVVGDKMSEVALKKLGELLGNKKKG